jgi:formylglycine-generating enzyme required for sulfatase activity
MEFVLIPAGEFDMGSPASDKDANPDEKPQHRVRILQPFYLGITEVTLGQFLQFVRATGHKAKAAELETELGQGWVVTSTAPLERDAKYTWSNTGFTQGPDYPVVNVSWVDADAFCEWLSVKESCTYRLPTEAEWEYACRAGSKTRFFFGDDPEDLAEFGNVADKTAKTHYPSWNPTIDAPDGHVHTAPVRDKRRANAFGLYDMHGNVWEWCQDSYESYPLSPVVDRPRPGPPTDRGVVRGGSFCTPPLNTRSAMRSAFSPKDRNSAWGFRVVRELKP